LVDAGVTVYFSHETRTEHQRRRLAADIQAVVAADFIRNLREETKKGFYGRLKQGIYPSRLRWLSRLRKGQAEVPDPERAPYVRKAFELYDAGDMASSNSADEMYVGTPQPQRGRSPRNASL